MKEFIAISDIKIVNRVRKDMGDLASLATSMETLGQLQAVGVDTENNLLFGHRRILAAKKLGWEKVWFERFDNLDDAANALLAERDENDERKPFTRTESVEMGRLLEAIKKRESQQRQREHGNTAPGRKAENTCEKFSQVSEDDRKTRNIVAKAVGMSGPTYDKAKAVVEAAEKPDATPEVKAARDEMDRTGKVDPAFKKVKAATTPVPPREPKQVREAFDMDAAKAKAEAAIRSAFRSWPEWTRKDIPTFLRQIAKGDW